MQSKQVAEHWRFAGSERCLPAAPGPGGFGAVFVKKRNIDCICGDFRFTGKSFCATIR
jgi:hypothetical protein